LSSQLKDETPQTFDLETCRNANKMLRDVYGFQVQDNLNNGVIYKVNFKSESFEIPSNLNLDKNTKTFMSILRKKYVSFLKKVGFGLDKTGQFKDSF
jgi:hypothetical protein